MSALDVNATDQDHIIESIPRNNDQNVPLGATISMNFDCDVKTMCISKLFEVIHMLSLCVHGWFKRPPDKLYFNHILY